MTRRELLRRVAFAFPAYSAAVQLKAANTDPQVMAILARIKAPSFPNRDFDITKYGGAGDGTKKCTEAIKAAIHACTAAAGGRVIIPRGNFLTGAIHLENNVNLYLSEGATLLFSRDPKDYLPNVFTRFESTECMNYSPFIYAFEKQNVAVTGPGTLDGQAGVEHWWPWTGRQQNGWKNGGPNAAKDRKLIVQMGDKNLPVAQRVFGEGHYLRPNFVQPVRCTNVLFEGFTVKRSPMWQLNPVLCQNVIARNVTIDSHGPNNDGFDPECCRDVLVTGCSFSTGDDCIAIKSGRNQDGRRVNVPCENIIIRDCLMKDGHGGVSIGSEVSGGVKNVFISDCQMSSPNLERGLRIKTNSYRGGEIDNIHFSNVTIGQVAQAAVEVDFFYEEGEGGPFKPVVKEIYISNVTSQKSKYGIFLRGFSKAPIAGVNLANCTFNDAAQGNFLQDVESVQVKDVRVNGRIVAAADLKSGKRS